MSGAWSGLIEKHFHVNGRVPNDDGWVSINCPLHVDKKQTAGLNLESGRFLCHSPECQSTYLTALNRSTEGAKTLSLAELLHFVNNWSVVDALSIVEGYRLDRIDTDFKHNDDTSTESGAESVLNFFPIDVEEFVSNANRRLEADFDSIDIAVDYSSSRGIERGTIVEAGVGFVPGRTDLPDNTTSGVHGCLLFPYWFRSKLVGVRVRQADSRKRMLRGSHYIPYGINSIFESTSRTVLVGEGESDTLRLTQAIRQAGYENIPVVGTPGVKFDYTWSRFFKRFNRVIAVPQADRPSQDIFVKHIRGVFGEKADVVQIPWEEDALGGKDVCDYFLMRPASTLDFVDLLGVSSNDAAERPYLKDYAYFENRTDRSIDWLIPNVVERGSKLLLVGDPKVGKTFIALNLIESLIAGTAFMGRKDWTPETKGLRCLLVEEEGSERAISNRILTIISPTDRLGVIHGEGVKLDDQFSFSRLRDAAMKFRPDVIVLDPYASLHNQDENTVEGTMRVMGAVNVLFRALPQSTIVILHHRSKLGGGARGSGSLWGAVDYQLSAFRPDGAGNRTVGVSVAGREIDEGDPLYFEFEPETMSYTPQPTTTIKLVSKKGNSPNLEKTDPVQRENIEKYLKDVGEWRSTNQIVTDVEGTDYLNTRAVLLEMAAEDLLDRQGSGGRGGYYYKWKTLD